MSMHSARMLMCLSGWTRDIFERFPELKEVGGGSFVLVTSSLHNEFDSFKQSHKQQTKRVCFH